MEKGRDRLVFRTAIVQDDPRHGEEMANIRNLGPLSHLAGVELSSVLEGFLKLFGHIPMVPGNRRRVAAMTTMLAVARKAKKAMSQKLCPICRRPAVDAYAPFCSKRCADVDLGRWLAGAYAIPAGEEDAEELPPPSADEA